MGCATSDMGTALPPAPWIAADPGPFPPLPPPPFLPPPPLLSSSSLLSWFIFVGVFDWIRPCQNTACTDATLLA